MAEGWARKWVEDEKEIVLTRQAARLNGLVDDLSEFNSVYDDRLLKFLDSLLVLSVALDETAIISSDNGKATSPTQNVCITCDGEMCPSEPQVRKSVKSKAIKAMAKDGVDISSFIPKAIHEITPQILYAIKENRSKNNEQIEQSEFRRNQLSVKSSTRRVIDFLEKSSKEMGFAYAGIKVQDNFLANRNSMPEADASEQCLMVDNLIVLCSCSTLKRRLSDMSKQTIDWDIDAPTDAAKAGEGDGAYIRVSRQIKCKVDEFLSNLKREAMTAKVVQ
jgi:protein-tyrosine-phosphatase